MLQAEGLECKGPWQDQIWSVQEIQWVKGLESYKYIE